MSAKHHFTGLLALVVLLSSYSCAINPVTGKRQLMLLSEDQEIALGASSDPQIVASYGLYEDEKLQAFIDDKGQEMARISHRPELNYEFKILDSPVVNAFAVPGGYVYFTRGIMAHFNNEAEFAGVLGHEIGHITARHSARQYSKQVLATLGLAVGMMVSEDFRQFAGMAEAGVSLLFLKFGRDNESESDRLGVEYSTTVGYDAHEMADFFKTLGRLSARSGASIPTFLSTHPDPADRYQKVQKQADKWQNKVRRGDFAVNQESYLNLIDGLVYGDDPRQGYVENNRFYHPELRFQFPTPRDWQIVNTPAQVQMAPESGEALIQLTLGQGSSPEAAARQMLEQYQLTELESSREQVNRLSALRIVFEQRQEGTDGQGRTVTQTNFRGLAYLIEYDNLIYQFLGVAKPERYNAYTAAFSRTMTEFEPLNDPGKLNVKPERIRIRKIGRPTTLRNALRSFGVPENRMEEMAVLNGKELDDRVEGRSMIKVVEKEE